MNEQTLSQPQFTKATRDHCQRWLANSYRCITAECTQDDTSTEHLDINVPLADLQALGGYALACWTLKQQQHPEYADEQHRYLLSVRLMNSLRRREATLIVAAFDNAGIDYRLLKGYCAWLHIYAGREEIRPVSDIDILVHPQDYEKAGQVLASIDYHPPKNLIRRRRERTSNQSSFSRQLGKFRNTVDLHRYPHNWPLHHHLGELAMSPQHCRTVQSFKTLSKPAAILWIACHRAKDRYLGDVRELLDARLIINSMSDTELRQTIAAVSDLKFQAFILQLMYQSLVWFGESDKPSQERQLIVALEQSSPRVACRARQRVADVQPSITGYQAPGGHWYTNPLGLFSQYLESLLTKGHRIEAVISMICYLTNKARLGKRPTAH